VGPIGLTVSDVEERSIAFYRHVQLGDETIELTQYLAPRSRPVPVDSRSTP